MLTTEFEDTPRPGLTLRLLREFAALCVGVFGALFAWSYVRHDGHPTVVAWVALAIALGVGLPGLIRPFWVRPFYLLAMALSQPIGHVIGLVLLAAVYYGLVTPLALVFRRLGRDQLGLLPEPGASSYWKPRPQPADPRRYLRQFQLSTMARESRESPPSTPGGTHGTD